MIEAVVDQKMRKTLATLTLLVLTTVGCASDAGRTESGLAQRIEEPGRVVPVEDQSSSSSGSDYSSSDYRFKSNFNASNIPFEINANKIYVRVSINNAGPFWFMLDSGAGFNVVDSKRAAALGIGHQGTSELRGAGEAAITASVGTNVSLGLTGLELFNQQILLLSLDSMLSFSEGRTVDGLLGYDFFKRFVVEINYADRRLNIYDAQTYKYDGAGVVLPLKIQRNHAFISTTLVMPGDNHVQGEFLVDTGLRPGLTLNTPFVEEYKVPARNIEAITGVGIGGEVRSVVGRVPALFLGRYHVRNPVVAFARSNQGVLASPDFTGIVGGGILQKFKVIFDYPGQRLILEANADFTEPDEFDMSGLFVIAEGAALNNFKIYSIVTNSPGDEAKLRAGDVIEKIDGRPASSFTLEQVRQIFKEGDGKTHLLGVRRGKKFWATKITLRRLI